MKKILLIIIFSSLISLLAGQKIAPDAKSISVKGCAYNKMKAGALTFPRFQEGFAKLKQAEIGFNMKKAATTSGVRLLFKSDSPKITLTFKLPAQGENRGSEFGVFINDVWHKAFSFKKKDGLELKFSIESKSDEMKKFEVTLPSWSNPAFLGLEIQDGGKMLAVQEKKKCYVAIGDSITHGVGQGSATYKTYAYLLSKKLNTDLYNMAVGGGKISLPVARQLADIKKIELMTILIGYNDWCSEGKTPAVYKAKYREFLKLVRASHPETKIFCISLLFTKSKKSKKTGLPPQPFRESLYELVHELQLAGDKNIFVIKGDSISSEKNLRRDNPSDPVHLGIEGAALLADALHKEIKSKSKL